MVWRDWIGSCSLSIPVRLDVIGWNSCWLHNLPFYEIEIVQEQKRVEIQASHKTKSFYEMQKSPA